MSPRRPDATVAAILAETATIRAALRAAGVLSADRDDLTQEVVIRAWLQFGDDTTKATRALLWVIAWRTGRAWLDLRATRQRRKVEPLEEAENVGHDPVRRLEARAALRVLRRLDPRERRIVEALAEGATMPELAARLHVSVGNAYRLVREMRRSLRRRK